jgi:hypothetical protein
MIGQCSSDYLITFWSFMKNVKIEHEWAPYRQTICFDFVY